MVWLYCIGEILPKLENAFKVSRLGNNIWIGPHRAKVNRRVITQISALWDLKHCIVIKLCKRFNNITKKLP